MTTLTRRLSLTLSLALAGITAAAGQNPDQPVLRSGTFNHYYAPNQPVKVSIESASGLISVIDVPEGVFLSVQARKDQNPSYREQEAGPRTLRGEIVIRLRRADELEAGESMAAHHIMAKARLEMRLTDATGVIEKM